MKIIPQSTRFECIDGCSDCCQHPGGFVYLSHKEASAIAEYLGAPSGLFLEWFTSEIDGQLVLKDGEQEACIFLEEGLCTIYALRPQQCRTYPFWPENMKTKERWELTRQECPGIGKGRKFSAGEIENILKGKTLDSKR